MKHNLVSERFREVLQESLKRQAQLNGFLNFGANRIHNKLEEKYPGKHSESKVKRLLNLENPSLELIQDLANIDFFWDDDRCKPFTPEEIKAIFLGTEPSAVNADNFIDRWKLKELMEAGVITKVPERFQLDSRQRERLKQLLLISLKETNRTLAEMAGIANVHSDFLIVLASGTPIEWTKQALDAISSICLVAVRWEGMHPVVDRKRFYSSGAELKASISQR